MYKRATREAVVERRYEAQEEECAKAINVLLKRAAGKTSADDAVKLAKRGGRHDLIRTEHSAYQNGKEKNRKEKLMPKYKATDYEPVPRFEALRRMRARRSAYRLRDRQAPRPRWGGGVIANG